MKDLISIVTPTYNGENFIAETIKSVQAQTYEHWEMLIVDDLSTDNTVEIVKAFAAQDARIKFFILPEKGGASLARNKAIREAKGDYIAFLDADDLWKPEKLEKQLAFMKEAQVAFCYHHYSLIDEAGQALHIRRIAPEKLSFHRALLGCSIGCLSVMYHAKAVGLIQIERLDKRNDDALWLKILEKCQWGRLLDEDLAYYRIVERSLSSGSKVKLLKYHYRLYRNIMNYHAIKSLYYTICNVFVYFYNKKRREIRL